MLDYFNEEEVNSIEKLEALGFCGSDASLDISLFEYDMAWKELDNKEWVFIHATPYTSGLDEEDIEFEVDFLNEDDFLNDLTEEDIASICDYTGSNFDEWNELSFYWKVYDTVNYFGMAHVFGDSYGGFKIDRGD